MWVDEIGDVFDAALVNGRPGYARPEISELESESSEGAMANKKVQKAGKAAQSARSNPYVQRLIEDEDLRQNIVQAFESARDAYGRLSNGKSPAKQIFDDKKLQKHIRETPRAACATSSVALHEAPKKQKRGGGGLGRVLLLGIVGGAVALAALRGPAQEGARRAVRRRGGVRVHLDHLVADTPAGTAA